MMAKDTFNLHGSNPHTVLTGEGDISSLCQFSWYEWCYYRDHTEKFPFNKEVLGRILGPAKGEGNEMAQWVLKANGNVVPRRTARPLTVAETHSTTELKKRGTFDALVEKRWGTSMSPPPVPRDDSESVFDEYEDDDEDKQVVPDVEDTVDATGKLLNQHPAYDRIINAEVALQLEEEVTTGKVTRRALGPDGQVAGTYDDNPFLNTTIYEVEFPDGQVKDYAANIIAENMLTQVDSDGFALTMMDGIIDYERDNAVAIPKSDAYVVTRHGRK